jgi:DnaJ-class molecular chaperone
MRSEAEEKFKDIKEAYEVLTDGTMPLYDSDTDV